MCEKWATVNNILTSDKKILPFRNVVLRETDTVLRSAMVCRIYSRFQNVVFREGLQSARHNLQRGLTVFLSIAMNAPLMSRYCSFYDF